MIDETLKVGEWIKGTGRNSHWCCDKSCLIQVTGVKIEGYSLKGFLGKVVSHNNNVLIGQKVTRCCNGFKSDYEIVED